MDGNAFGFHQRTIDFDTGLGALEDLANCEGAFWQRVLGGSWIDLTNHFSELRGSCAIDDLTDACPAYGAATHYAGLGTGVECAGRQCGAIELTRGLADQSSFRMLGDILLGVDGVLKFENDLSVFDQQCAEGMTARSASA